MHAEFGENYHEGQRDAGKSTWMVPVEESWMQSWKDFHRQRKVECANHSMLKGTVE